MTLLDQTNHPQNGGNDKLHRMQDDGIGQGLDPAESPGKNLVDVNGWCHMLCSVDLLIIPVN